MNLEDWPDCHVHGCTNKICLALDSQYCYPHSFIYDPMDRRLDREVFLLKALSFIDNGHAVEGEK